MRRDREKVRERGGGEGEKTEPHPLGCASHARALERESVCVRA